MMKTLNRYYPLLIALFAGFLLFYNLGAAPLSEWDESRYGVNAVEMAKRGDYINYYYAGALDIWNAKPPLQVWLIVGASKIFGFNEFSLRLPSALAGVVALIFIFLIGRRFGGSRLGWLSVLGAITCRALIGPHVARTGEMDAWFIAGLAIFAFGILAALDSTRTRDWLIAALGLSVAFFAKGFAFGAAGPAILVLFFRSRWREHLRSRGLWMAVAVFVIAVGSWLVTLALFGAHSDSTNYNGHTVLEVMFFNDILARFSGTLDSRTPAPLNPLGVLRHLDIRFSAWYYLVILAGLLVIIRKAHGVDATGTVLFKTVSARREALWFSALFSFTILGVVAMTRQQNDWYITPIVIAWPLLLLCLADMLMAIGFVWFRITVFVGTFAVLINGFQMLRYVAFESEEPSGVQRFFRENISSLRQADVLKIDGRPRQDELLYYLWTGVPEIEFGSKQPSSLERSYKLSCSNRVCELGRN